MTNEQKNKWLTEKVLGECWHRIRKTGSASYADTWFHCIDCKKIAIINPDFYSSDENEQAINFFKLWRAIQGKEWFEEKIPDMSKYKLPYSFINCSALADDIGEYFEWGEVK